MIGNKRDQGIYPLLIYRPFSVVNTLSKRCLQVGYKVRSGEDSATWVLRGSRASRAAGAL